ncbi:MAG: hypothetical protein IKE38_04165 [Erysipelotrichaceae bacterium]|nr:hypothetical protein [Erysipelotrichaceae bacterium]
MNARETALDIIYKTISDKSYTNLLMRKKLEGIEALQRPFLTGLVNGVLKEYDFLIFQVKDLIDDKTSLRNRIIIAMALYERFYLHEKEYAVNNEYVELGKNKYDRSFINAVLRKVRDLRKSDDEYINESLPEWIYKLLERQYEEEELRRILDNYKRIPKVYYRINHKKASFEDFRDIGIIDEDVFTCKENLIGSSYMKEGLFYIQDLNSASLYRHLKLKEDDLLLDVCSAPGSKLFNCLDVADPHKAYANDLYPERVKLIKDKAQVLGFEGINYLCHDGTKLKDVLDMKFDKIMLDAPCSGLGTLGRKADLKYHIESSSLDELEKIQADLLESVKDLLKEGGILLYSTCTLNKKEYARQIENFLKNNAGFRLLEEDTLIKEEGDCFYYAALTKEYNG